MFRVTLWTSEAYRDQTARGPVSTPLFSVRGRFKRSVCSWQMWWEWDSSRQRVTSVLCSLVQVSLHSVRSERARSHLIAHLSGITHVSSFRRSIWRRLYTTETHFIDSFFISFDIGSCPIFVFEYEVGPLWLWTWWWNLTFTTPCVTLASQNKRYT